MIGNNGIDIVEPTVDTFYGFQVTIATQQAQINEGKAFFTNYNWDAGLDVVKDLLMVVPVTELIIYLEDDVRSELGTSFAVYVNNTVTVFGVEILSNNKYPASGKVPVLKLYHTPAIGALGPLIYSTQWGSGKKIGGLRQGSGAIITPNVNVLFRIKSLAASNNITHELHWTEDIDKNL